jgi:hypothetical protein
VTGRDGPVLSICVPTRNRALLLDDLIRSLEPELERAGDDVEVVIADNASRDGTADVVRARLRDALPIRYVRRPADVGPGRSMWELIEELARGEFCWVVGDDDVVFRGAVPALVERLTAVDAPDYLYLNYAIVDLDRRRAIIDDDSRYAPSDDECFIRDRSDRVLPRWDDLLAADSWLPIAVYTSILPHVFRRDAWFRHAGGIDRVHADFGESFDGLFHLLRPIATMMAGRPTVYIGEPLVAQGGWHQEWTERYSPAIFVAYLEQLRLFEVLGVDRSRLDSLRRDLLASPVVRGSIARLLAEPGLPGRAMSSPWRFAWDNRSEARALAAIAGVAARAVAGRWSRPLRARVRSALSSAPRSAGNDVGEQQ